MRLKLSKILVITILILFSVENVMAAIVSDNDGSAFVSKAEFDALKNNFNGQISGYNASVDSKIDGAIASYLSGLDILTPPVNLWQKYCDQTGGKMYFLQSLDGGSATVDPKWEVSNKNDFYCEIVNNLSFHISWMQFPYCYINSPGTAGVGVTATTALHSGVICGNPTTYDPGTGYKDRIITNDYGAAVYHTNYTVKNFNGSYSLAAGTGTAQAKATYKDVKNNKVKVNTEGGSGKAWQYQLLNGKKCLKYYCKEIYPLYAVDINSHGYKKYTLTNDAYFTDAGKNYAPTWTDRSVDAAYGAKNSVGTKEDSDSKDEDNYVEINTSLVKVTDDYKYLDAFWSATSDWDIYAYDEDYVGDGVDTTTANTKTINGEKMTWYDTHYSGMGASLQTNEFTGSGAKVRPLKFAPTKMKISDFSNDTISSISNHDARQGYGAPIVAIEGLEQSLKVKIKVGAEGTGTQDIAMKMSNKPFNLGEFSTDAKCEKFVDTVLTSSGGYEKEYTFTLKDKEDCVWLWLDNQTDNSTVYVDYITVK